MSQQLSPQKVTRLMSLHLAGLSETAVARRLNISQSTVSLYASRFGAAAAQRGLEAAGKEFNIMDQVRALHHLGAELAKAELTVEESCLGVKVQRKLQALGVSDEDYPDLVAAATRMKSEGYLQAAMRLGQLEKSTGLPYRQVVANHERAIKGLGDTRNELKAAAAKLNQARAQVSAMEAKKRTASRGLADHLDRVAADMKRIEKVERLALALKAAGILDGDLDKMIQHQQRLNEAGISLATLTSIMEKVGVATSRDQGRQLLKMFSEHGGLAGALEEQRTRLDALTRKADGWEAKAREKAQIESQMAGLRIERSELEGTVARLKEEIRPLTGLQNEVGLLMGRKAALESETASLHLQRRLLDRDIVARQQKVGDLSEQEARHKELSADTDAMLAKLADNQQRFQVLDAFVGLISATSMDRLELFAEVLPEIIAKARLKQKSPNLLADSILSRLAGDVLKIHRCTSCGTRFVADKPAVSDLGYACPVCCFSSGVGFAEDATAILRGVMGLQPAPTATPRTTAAAWVPRMIRKPTDVGPPR